MLLFSPECRNVLRGLRRISDSSDRVLTFVSDAPFICRFDNLNLVYDYTQYSKEIFSIIRQLAEDGYVRYLREDCQFILTSKGLHPWRQVLLSVFTSVVVPMVVAFATTCVTLLTKGLLKLP